MWYLIISTHTPIIKYKFSTQIVKNISLCRKGVAVHREGLKMDKNNLVLFVLFVC